MDITLTHENNENQLIIQGCLDTLAAPEFEEALSKIPAGEPLVIDFKGVEFIASSGLRILVRAKRQREAAGGSLALQNLNDVVQEVFDMTGLVEEFEIR